MGLPKCVTARPMWRRTEPNQGPNLCSQVSLSSHTHTYQHRHQKKNLLVPLSPPPCIYTLKGISRRDIIFVSLSLDLSHFLCYLSHAPPPAGPSIHASLEYVIHTYLSRPCQMHQLHIHTCYITYPIDLKSPLFTFISHKHTF